MDRRQLLSFAALASLLPVAACAQTTGTQTLQPQTLPAGGAKPLLPPLESFPLWPNGAPGAENVTVTEEWILRNPAGGDPNDTAATHVTKPILMVRRPANPNGSAILMIPGGGYQRVAVSRAGGGTDKELADKGVTVFTLVYRLPADGWAAGFEAPLQDVQRAIRLIRYRAAEFSIDTQRVGVIGFSAGGHLAGWAATAFAKKTYEPVDAADNLSARPDVAGLFYPVITTRAPVAHGGSVKNLLGADRSEERLKATSINELLPADAPPVFVAHAANDPVVPADNSVIMWQALRAQKTPTELHIFEVGGHSLRDGNAELPWLSLFSIFARRHGLWADSW
ncbi:alpha/beta hydrolase [Asticcacaulis tiandongensis]|uniref:alpha/beta hydrolase n=1 Tax=Asticcacaulis tiandongensis TaxID=2565365 RepID=UPI00112D0141|nr:alpha/beta hydrolase [Asticcacaulis tiandongensis]